MGEYRSLNVGVSGPGISVCIANYNGAGILDACLASVLAQDCAFPVEIIVHDDASTDGSADGLEERYPGLKVIRSQENVGFCVSNNRMVAGAQGEYILLLNNDAELFPDALRVLMDAAMSIGRPAILGLPQFDAADGHLIDRGSLFDPFLNPIPNLDPARHDVGMVMGACLWIPRSLWDEIGGFPEWFGSLAEDMYLCCVARLWGHPVRVLAESGFRHWVGRSFGGGKITVEGKLVTSAKRRAMSERNKSFVLLLCYPLVAIIVLVPLHAFLLLAETGLMALVRGSLDHFRQIFLPTVISLARSGKTWRKQRCLIQSRRLTGWLEYFSVFRPYLHKLAMVLRHGLPSLR